MNSPKGFLVAIHKSEDLCVDYKTSKKEGLHVSLSSILSHVTGLLKDEGSLIEIITTTNAAEETFKQYKKALKELGYANVAHMNIKDRKATNDNKYLQRLERCSCVIFTGDDQLRLCSILGGSTLLYLLQERYVAERFIVAGIGAAASVVSDIIIDNAPEMKVFLKGEVNVSMGLGFISNVIVDVHFNKTSRFGILAQAIAEQPGTFCIGLEENTGIIIEQGRMLRTIGCSCVTIIDGSSVDTNNIASVHQGAPISVTNLTVHILSKNILYDMYEREVIHIQQNKSARAFA